MIPETDTGHYECAHCGMRLLQTQMACHNCGHKNLFSTRYGHNVKTDGKAMKADAGRPQLSLVPIESLELCAAALEYGTRKYSRNNYRKGLEWNRLLDATLRHVNAFAAGDENDNESGVNHIGHALACLSMLAYNMKHNTDGDDR